jgi:Lon-like ATP-dependent protease
LLWLTIVLAGIGSIFHYLQENNHRAQEQIQQHNAPAAASLKHLCDMLPTVLYDPREHFQLMARISEPNARNIEGGFRHDPYQSGNWQIPPHQRRVYLGAQAPSPIVYIDELRTLIRIGYMPELLEIMQEKQHILEGGQGTGSGAADRCENYHCADNIYCGLLQS